MIKQTNARVVEKRLLTPHLAQLILAPAHYIPYAAGQYLQIMSSSTEYPSSYSIANAPHMQPVYELHIRTGIETLQNTRLVDLMTPDSDITLQLPFGACTLDALDPTQPILFIAGGAGFAPIKAMLEALYHENNTRCVHLIWRAKNAADLYLDALVRQWVKNSPWMHYTPQVSKTHRDSIQSILSTHEEHSLLDWQIVLAGPFDMVYALRDELITQGITPDRMHSDAFAFEHKA